LPRSTSCLLFAGTFSFRSTHLWKKGRIRSLIHILTMDSDLGGLKTCGSCGSGSPTLARFFSTNLLSTYKFWKSIKSILRIRILLFWDSFWHFIFEKWCKCS
jgi:hypothetical protein